jgi:multidrug resistance efflux pump
MTPRSHPVTLTAAVVLGVGSLAGSFLGAAHLVGTAGAQSATPPGSAVTSNVAGAKVAVQQAEDDLRRAQKGLNAAKAVASQALTAVPPDTVAFCNGVVDTEDGLTPLSPAPPVPVPAVTVADVKVKDGETVWAGQEILKLDDALARAAVREADAAVEMARVKLVQAERGPETQRRLLAQQQEAVKAAQAKFDATATGLGELKKVESKGLATLAQVKAAEQGIEGYRAAVKAEQLKLDQIQANDPNDLIHEARAALRMAEAKAAQARETLKQYVLTAPSDGLIVRLTVQTGGVISAQARQPAVWFLPGRMSCGSAGACKLHFDFIVRAELDQEFAGGVEAGMPVDVQDEMNPPRKWSGTVKRVPPAYLPKRPAPAGDVVLTTDPGRTLETVIAFDDPSAPVLVGQRVRVTIKKKKS